MLGFLEICVMKTLSVCWKIERLILKGNYEDFFKRTGHEAVRCIKNAQHVINWPTLRISTQYESVRENLLTKTPVKS